MKSFKEFLQESRLEEMTNGELIDKLKDIDTVAADELRFKLLKLRANDKKADKGDIDHYEGMYSRYKAHPRRVKTTSSVSVS